MGFGGFQQVAHIPGALFFDVDGISDRATNVRCFFLIFICLCLLAHWSSHFEISHPLHVNRSLYKKESLHSLLK